MMTELDKTKQAEAIAFSNCQSSAADTALATAQLAQANKFSDAEYQKFTQTVAQFRNIYAQAANADRQNVQRANQAIALAAAREKPAALVSPAAPAPALSVVTPPPAPAAPEAEPKS